MGDVQTLTVGDINWMNDEEFSKNWKNIPCIFRSRLGVSNNNKNNNNNSKEIYFTSDSTFFIFFCQLSSV